MTDLVTKQIWFTRYLGFLFTQFDNELISVGEAWRSDETCRLYAKEGKGVPISCHEFRIAIDIILRNADGSPSNHKSDYQPLADYWKQLPNLYPASIPIVTCWGGDFISLADIYHFSIEHSGIR